MMIEPQRSCSSAAPPSPAPAGRCLLLILASTVRPSSRTVLLLPIPGFPPIEGNCHETNRRRRICRHLWDVAGGEQEVSRNGESSRQPGSTVELGSVRCVADPPQAASRWDAGARAVASRRGSSSRAGKARSLADRLRRPDESRRCGAGALKDSPAARFATAQSYARRAA